MLTLLHLQVSRSRLCGQLRTRAKKHSKALDEIYAKQTLTTPNPKQKGTFRAKTKNAAARPPAEPLQNLSHSTLK